MKRLIIATALTLLVTPAYADSYTTLSHAVVRATMSEDYMDTVKPDPKPFAKCFKAQGLTEKDLKTIAKIKTATLDARVDRCYEKLVGH